MDKPSLFHQDYPDNLSDRDLTAVTNTVPGAKNSQYSQVLVFLTELAAQIARQAVLNSEELRRGLYGYRGICFMKKPVLL